MLETSPTDCPNYRFKVWTWHEKRLEFTLAAINPRLPPKMFFANVNSKDTNVAMVRCVTAHQLWKQDVVTSPPGDVYHSTAGWWLLVNSLDESSLVSPGTLLISLQNIRTLVELDNTLCFRLAKIFRSKIHIQHWLQLLAIIFCRQAKIGLLDKQPYTFETPVTVLEAFAVVRDWSTTNMGNRPLRQLSSARSSSHCLSLC